MPSLKEKTLKIIHNHGGSILSGEIINQNSRLKVKCKKDHIWPVSVKHIVYSGSWCRTCRKTKITIDDLVSKAEQRGGTCLETKYLGHQTHHRFKCNEGHFFKLTYNKLQQNRWCDKCTSNYGEVICRQYLEYLFSKKFSPTNNLTWLKTNDGTFLRLDGYNKELGIAFEHQGIQHFKYSKYFFKSKSAWKKQLERDRLKKELCKNNNVVLIEIPELFTMTKEKDLPSLIKNILTLNGIKIPKKLKEFAPKIDKENSYLIRMQKIAIKKGGRLLSTVYSGQRAYYDFECSEHHTWPAKGSHILKKHGTWCLKCKIDRVGRKNRIFNSKQIKEIRKLLKNGETGVSLAQKYKCSSKTIYDIGETVRNFVYDRRHFLHQHV